MPVVPPAVGVPSAKPSASVPQAPHAPAVRAAPPPKAPPPPALKRRPARPPASLRPPPAAPASPPRERRVTLNVPVSPSLERHEDRRRAELEDCGDGHWRRLRDEEHRDYVRRSRQEAAAAAAQLQRAQQQAQDRARRTLEIRESAARLRLSRERDEGAPSLWVRLSLDCKRDVLADMLHSYYALLLQERTECAGEHRKSADQHRKSADQHRKRAVKAERCVRRVQRALKRALRERHSTSARAGARRVVRKVAAALALGSGGGKVGARGASAARRARRQTPKAAAEAQDSSVPALCSGAALVEALLPHAEPSVMSDSGDRPMLRPASNPQSEEEAPEDTLPRSPRPARSESPPPPSVAEAQEAEAEEAEEDKSPPRTRQRSRLTRDVFEVALLADEADKRDLRAFYKSCRYVKGVFQPIVEVQVRVSAWARGCVRAGLFACALLCSRKEADAWSVGKRMAYTQCCSLSTWWLRRVGESGFLNICSLGTALSQFFVQVLLQRFTILYSHLQLFTVIYGLHSLPRFSTSEMAGDLGTGYLGGVAVLRNA